MRNRDRKIKRGRQEYLTAAAAAGEVEEEEEEALNGGKW